MAQDRPNTELNYAFIKVCSRAQNRASSGGQ
jgi:hypothetical protein